MRRTVAAALALGAAALSGALVAAALPWVAAVPSVIAVDTVQPPYELAAGQGASRERFIQDFALSENRTAFTARIQAKVGGDMVVRDVFRVESLSSDTRTVTLRGEGVSQPTILAYTWTVKDGPTTVATLDLKAGSPSATFALPAGASYHVDLRIQLLKGAGANDASVSSAIWSVTG